MLHKILFYAFGGGLILAWFSGLHLLSISGQRTRWTPQGAAAMRFWWCVFLGDLALTAIAGLILYVNFT